MKDSQDFYRLRAVQEARAAESARCEEARSAHLELAARYAEMISNPAGETAAE